MTDEFPPSFAARGHPTVIVADDRGLIRLGIVQLLRDLEPQALIIEVESCEDLIDVADHGSPELIIVGLELHDLLVPDCFDHLGAVAPRAAIVGLAEATDGPLIERCTEAGVRCVISTSDRRDHVADVLRRVLAGEALGATERRVSARSLRPVALSALDSFSPGLSRRQMNLIRLLASGRSNREIAAIFGVQVGAVRADIAAILRIFGMGSLRASHLMRGE